MVADKTVGNAAVVQALIAFCHAQKVPLVALTPSQVKEGATLAARSQPHGHRTAGGRLANRIIHEKVDPGALAVAQPEGLDLPSTSPPPGSWAPPVTSCWSCSGSRPRGTFP